MATTQQFTDDGVLGYHEEHVVLVVADPSALTSWVVMVLVNPTLD